MKFSTAIAGLLACACVHPRTEPGLLGISPAADAEIPDALPSEFVLLCWNTHRLGDPAFADELERFAADVDLFVLQEAIESEPVWSLVPGEQAWTLVIAFEFGRADIATGVATGSAATPSRELALLSPGHEPLVATRKSSLLTWIALAERDTELLLVNLHGINFRPAAALEAQLDALDESIAAHAGPVVVAGDFNAWTGRRRAVVEAFAAKHELLSAFNGAAQPRLDGVYVRGLVVGDAEILPSRSSDHDALRVELSLP